MILPSLITKVGGALIDKIFPNQADKDKAQLALLQMQHSGELQSLANELEISKQQSSITAIEAQQEGFFKSGARPALLWATGLIFVIPGLMPYISWLLLLCGVHTPELPIISSDIYTTALFGLLGLSGMRSYDKSRGLK